MSTLTAKSNTENMTSNEQNSRRPSAWHTLRGRLSVRGWVQLILAAMVLVVCGCTAAAGLLLARANDRTTELVDRIQPARSNVFQLQKSLLDQETGVRGFALTADPSFLAPYDQGLKDERRFTGRVKIIVAGDPVFTQDLAHITRAAEQWRSEEAEPLIASVRTRGAEAASAERVTQSKAAFDRLRDLFAVQQSHLDQAREEARAELTGARELRDIVLVVVLIVFVLSVAGLAFVLHRMVGRPLNTLRAASDRVRAGAFDHRIQVGGPSDLRAVGAAVEDMRRRLADELAVTRARETLLAEQAEELRRSNSELEQFAYVASHDLQEPLRKVASFCQLLEKRYGDELDDRGKQYIDFAVDGAKRMQILINDLLTFSRVGRVHDAWQPVPMDKVLDRALGNLALAIEESDVTLVRQDPLPEVTGDPTTLAMLWQNLVGNAIKFRTPGEPPRITIGCTREGDEWHVTVADNGIGVAPEFAEKVFIIFQRLHARDEYEGTGIGLALCRKIVEFHGGRIWLESGEGGGTRIHFTVPALAGEATVTEAAGPARSAVPGPSGAPDDVPAVPGLPEASEQSADALLTTPPGAAQ